MTDWTCADVGNLKFRGTISDDKNSYNHCNNVSQNYDEDDTDGRCCKLAHVTLDEKLFNGEVAQYFWSDT